MSDTPRTDALLLEINEGRIYETVGPVTELACTLERELAEAHRAISEVTNERDELFLVKNRLVNALHRIAITDDADCVLADDPKAMTRIAREALR